MSEEVKQRHQVNFNISLEKLIKIKMAAARRNITMNKWIMRAIDKAMVAEKIDEIYP
jgi:predicted HicB family RNase H-like nuclease